MLRSKSGDQEKNMRKEYTKLRNAKKKVASFPGAKPLLAQQNGLEWAAAHILIEKPLQLQSAGGRTKCRREAEIIKPQEEGEKKKRARRVFLPPSNGANLPLIIEAGGRGKRARRGSPRHIARKKKLRLGSKSGESVESFSETILSCITQPSAKIGRPAAGGQQVCGGLSAKERQRKKSVERASCRSTKRD